VGAIGEEPGRLEEAVRHVYDWHNSRSVTGMQLTFAPAATALLAIVAKPDSTPVIVAASGVVFVAVVLGVGQLLLLNGLHGEYVFAVRLAATLRSFQTELEPYPQGADAPPGSVARLLYVEIGSVPLVKYRSSPRCREKMLRLLAECRGVSTPPSDTCRCAAAGPAPG
jgi:hypothetical protein